jgi:hypothetical protein
MSDGGEQSNTTICEACGTAVPSYDAVSCGSIERGYRELCTSCFNAEVASALGLERFEQVRLEPVVMTDCAGEQHEFHFQIRLLGDVMALDAFELKAGVPGGYQFEILGEPDADGEVDGTPRLGGEHDQDPDRPITRGAIRLPRLHGRPLPRQGWASLLRHPSVEEGGEEACSGVFTSGLQVSGIRMNLPAQWLVSAASYAAGAATLIRVRS